MFYQVESTEAEPDKYNEIDIKLVEDQSLTFSSNIIDAPREFWDLFNFIDLGFQQKKKKRVVRYINLLSPFDTQKNIKLEYE